MIAIITLSLVCTLLWIIKREKTTLFSNLGLRVKSEDLYFSGNSLFSNPMNVDMKDPPRLKIHTLFTATFFHDSRSHIINNMLMLYGIAEFETKLGVLVYLFLFVMCGVTGWLTSLFWRRWKMPIQWSEGIVQFQESVGSSPATYGVAIAAATILGDAPVGHCFGLSPTVWVCLLLCLPKFCGERYEVNLLTSPSKWTLKALGAAVAVLFLCYMVNIVLPPVSMPLTADRWMVLYLVGNFALGYVQPSYIRGEQHPDQTDHASHCGGALLGLWWGAVLSKGDGLYRMEVWFCVVWLLLRMVLEKK